jgi:LuxR family maltose regulon positive regulatory protein
MSAPLLTTKLQVPPSRLELVPRPFLIERLNAGLSGKLTLISAPAGFGKTTLVVDWLANALPNAYQGRIAWLSLDGKDNTPVQFWNYVIAALQTIDSSWGKVPQTTLQTSPSPPIETILVTLINEIAAQEQPLILGLDDYHEITRPEIHTALEFLVENLPANMHLVMATREDPPLSLSRLRVRGQLTEIRAADLRFSATESTTFFNDLLSLALTSDDIDSLTARTEGWIAGLQLAALSLQNTNDKSEFVRVFTGSHRFLTDYLVDEVLSRQTPDVQLFLRRTSILERFCIDVCNELVETGDSRQILRQLEQTNLFLTSLDNERHWFRYHHLFAEFLNLRLVENEPEIIPQLYSRAIDWFTQAELHREALQYALQAQAYDRAADLIETLAPEILAQDNQMQLIQWSEALPQNLVTQRAYLCVYLGWAWVLAAQMDTANQWLDAAETRCAHLEPDDAQIIRGHVAAHRAYIVFLHGEYRQTIDLAQHALELLPLNETTLRARTITCLGNAYNYAGRLQEAKIAFGEAIEIAKKIGSLSLAMFSYCSLGEVFRDGGRLNDAKDAYEQLLKFAEELTGKQELPLTGFAIFEIGVVLREWNELDRSIEQFKKGIDLCREWHQGEALVIGLLELTETHRIRGEYVQAEAALKEARPIAEAISPWAVNLVNGHAARVALAQGDLEAVVRWAKQSGLDDEACEVGYERFPECLPLIRMHIAIGHPQQALALTKRLIKRDQAFGRMGRVLDLLVLQVAALHALGQTDRALQTLAEAVELAAPEKHIRPFVDSGPQLVPYLQKFSPSPYRDRLLVALGEVVESKPTAPDAETALLDPLNDREIAILRLMSAGRSNKEIGDELYLSVNTIRWYASQIYMKLGVKNRGEAAARANQLDLL